MASPTIAHPTPPLPHASLRPSVSTWRVLLVEDDPASADLVKDALREHTRHTFRCTHASDLESAVADLEKITFDAILLDLSLPGSTGLETFHAIRRQAPHTPVIVLTASDDEDLGLALLHQGAQDYLVKGRFDLQLLARTLCYAIERHRIEAALRALLSAVPDWVLRIDSAGRCLEIKGAPCKNHFPLLRLRAGDSVHEILPVSLRPTFSDCLRTSLLDGTLQSLEVHFPHESRKQILELRISRCAPGEALLLARDITEIHHLQKGVLEAVEKEQRRIAHDLHDSVGQLLTAISFLSKGLEQKLAASLPDSAAEARRISDLSAESALQTQQLARGLSPLECNGDSLPNSLIELASRTQNIFACPCEVQASPSVRMSDPQAATHLFRIAQEAIHNAVKHRRSPRLRIILKTENKEGCLQIENEGGEPASGIRTTPGLGLQIMQYRARLIDGTLNFEQTPQGTSRVTCLFPLASC